MYKAISQNTIPDVQANLYDLPSNAQLSLAIDVDGTQYTRTFSRDGLAWPWYEYGGVDQCWVFDNTDLYADTGDTGSVCWEHDALGAYRVLVTLAVPFTIVQLVAADTDLDYLMNFGAVEFVEDAVPPIDPDPEEPPMPTPTPTYGFGIVFSVAAAAALRAQLDEQVGFQKSTSNVIVNGVTGISQPVTWDLEDPDTDAGYLNSHQVTTLIQNQGLRFWGNRNCSEDPRFSFEVATRTAQIVLETIVQGCAIFADQPLIPQLAKDIIDSIQAKLDEFTAAGQLIGASVWYDPAENSTEALSQGQFWVDYDYTPVPTLENLGLNQRITDRYLVDFAKLIAQAT